MPIRITCPHCKRGMLVDERLAGKKGKCKACQQPITVPPLPSANSAAAEPAPAPAQAAAPVDVEAEAAAMFADEQKPAEPVETKTIDLNCPFCDEAIHFPASDAGKRAPCPECRQIIKVPELVKKEAKDWRKVEARGPSGARQQEQPELEGAWSSTTARGVGQQTLQEAGVIPKVKPPRTLWQKYRLPVLCGSLALVVGLIGLFGYQWWSRRALEGEVRAALAFADSPEAKPAEKAALALAAGEYYFRSRTSHTDPNTGRLLAQGIAANNQFGKALTALRSVSASAEHDALLTDLALAEIELGGDKPDTEQGLRLPWDKVQQMLLATLREIREGEAKLHAFREATRRLRERGQASRAPTLTNQLYPAADADKAAALSAIGLDSLKAGDRPAAEKAAEAALLLFPKQVKEKDAKAKAAPAKENKAPPLRAEVIALGLLLEKDKKDLPAAGENPEDKANELIGKAEALARQGKWEDARKLASRSEEKTVQFRALLAIAEAAADAQQSETADIEAAVKAAEEGAGKKPELAWSMLRLIKVASGSGLPEERIQALAGQIGNPALRGRAQLEVLRSRLSKSNEIVEDAAADKVEAKSLARSLAAQALARHNTRLNKAYAGAVQAWPQPLRSFGALGFALGLQDQEK